MKEAKTNSTGSRQVCLRPRDRFWDIPALKIDTAFDNLFVPQPSWSPSTTQQLRKLFATPYLSPNDWTPRLDAYFASPLALCARRVSSAASRLLGTTSLLFALHGWQRMKEAKTNLTGSRTVLLLSPFFNRRHRRKIQCRPSIRPQQRHITTSSCH